MFIVVSFWRPRANMKGKHSLKDMWIIYPTCNLTPFQDIKYPPTPTENLFEMNIIKPKAENAMCQKKGARGTEDICLLCWTSEVLALHSVRKHFLVKSDLI